MKKWLSLIIFCFFTNIFYGEDIKAEDIKAIDQFKTYLREIKSVAIDFTQEDSLGNKASGKLLISKPYRFRCNYYSPYPLLIVGSQNYVSVYDYEMKDTIRIKPSENIFNFLLEERVDFDRYFDFEEAIDEGNIFKITIYHTLSERRSRITFNKSTKQILMIEILEDDNVIKLTFNQFTNVAKFDDDLFILKNPEIFGQPLQLTKEQIIKKYLATPR